MQRIILAFIASVLIGLSACYLLIPLLKRLKAGQYIYGYVKEHEHKSGTPTMAGIAFILTATAVCAIFGALEHKLSAVVIIVAFAYMLVGFLDDLLKLSHKENGGLKPYQKILFQLAIGIIVGVFCYNNRLYYLLIPFSGINITLGWWIIPFSALVFLACSNCVNLTDGLDGLAAGVTAAYLVIFGLLNTLQGGSGEVSLTSFALSGALCGFLVFNTNKASVFMGDTGSLALGGAVAALALISGNALYIVIIGIVYVLSGLSVIVQVLYYKKTKKRVFLMAPLHHHFQMRGFSETKIAYCYFITTLTAGLACICYYL